MNLNLLEHFHVEEQNVSPVHTPTERHFYIAPKKT
jgi:hypothetical protein